jgi:hypothetical protein
MGQSRYLTRVEASTYLLEIHSLRRSPKYLAKLAVNGAGPAFHKANHAVLYDPADLDAYATRVIGPAVYSNMEHRLVSATKAA